MQIRTGLALGTGVLLGMAIGVCVNEDTKIKKIEYVKKKIIRLLTGENWEPKRSPVHYTNYKYAKYNKPLPLKDEKECKNDE